MASSERLLRRRPAARLLSVLWLAVVLAACERTPPPPLPGPVADAATPASPQSTLVESVSTDDPRIGTEVGERRLGLGMTTTGKTGWLVFGPYMPLPAGRYQVALQGSVQDGHAGPVHVDVAQGKGSDILVAVDLEAPALLSPPSPDGIVVLPFVLKEATSSLEVRVRVADTSKLSISGFVIRAVP